MPPFEEPGILQDHAEIAPQPCPCHRPGIHSIEQDTPAIHLVETHQEVDEGGLAGSRLADNRDGLARLRDEAHIVHQDLPGS